MQMDWQDLVFLHWPVPALVLAPHLPASVELDLWDGQAWLSIVAFQVTNFRPRGAPLGLKFGQVNLRTYVQAGGIPAIWTFSLDAGQALAVLGARVGYQLPYHQADVSLQSETDWLEFRSVRSSNRTLSCKLQYRPVGPARPAQAGTLEHWLTERRALFTVGWGQRLWRADVEHEPWPLQQAQVRQLRTSLPDQVGAVLPGSPLAHYSQFVHVRGWLPQDVREVRARQPE
ncbi:hypothetical protein GCM10008955_32360 [Deinococcus malanensis]|uniref:DUF2071 domain-containing protein n=3 Tax=Deinococcus malanensis TaxID=1706855 RepID=A0ABQ2F0D9_9DEIO|nr:hypothetical protein GCM10008955_32360 [Deinococcus malanensis]